MTQPTLSQLGTEDILTAIVREGARKLLAAALRTEVDEHLERWTHVRDERGRQLVVRNGYLPEREVQTGIGPVPVQQPRVRQRKGAEHVPRFQSKLLPPYLRRTRSIEELIPWLYLKGVSTSDVSEALVPLLGAGVEGLSPGTVVRLKKTWETEYANWSRRSLAPRRYVYVWADGIYVNVRLEGERRCLLVVMGATTDGYKELIAVHDGVRESEESWSELLLDLKTRGLQAPEVAVGDGALGFWNALSKIFPTTRMQRCWVHKTANVLNRLPKSRQAHAKKALQDIWMSATREDAVEAFDSFVAAHQVKYPAVAGCLTKDRDELLAFYDFPAEHWKHLRTSNPIESAFATVRLRTYKTKGNGSRLACLTMVFKLAKSAERRWRRLDGHLLIADVIAGIPFKNGTKVAA